MNEKYTFTVDCPMYPHHKEKFVVYYVKHEGKWLPLPPLVCDNSPGTSACQECVAKVISEALKVEPPFCVPDLPPDPHNP